MWCQLVLDDELAERVHELLTKTGSCKGDHSCPVVRGVRLCAKGGSPRSDRDTLAKVLAKGRQAS